MTILSTGKKIVESSLFQMKKQKKFHWRREERKLFINSAACKAKKISFKTISVVSEESRKVEKKNVEWVPSVNSMKNGQPKIRIYRFAIRVCLTCYILFFIIRDVFGVFCNERLKFK
jgi:hypothetical protein